MLGHDVRCHAVNFDDCATRWAHCCDHHVFAERVEHFTTQVESFGHLVQVTKLDLASDGNRVDRAFDDASHELLERRGVSRELPLVQPKFPEIRAAREQRFGQRLATLAVVEQEHSAPRNLQVTQRVDQLGRGERFTCAQRRWHTEATQGRRRLRSTTDGADVAERRHQLRVTAELLSQLEQERDGDTGHENHDLMSTVTQLVEQFTHSLWLDAWSLTHRGHAQRRSTMLLDEARELALHTRLEQRHHGTNAAFDRDR